MSALAEEEVQGHGSRESGVVGVMKVLKSTESAHAACRIGYRAGVGVHC